MRKIINSILIVVSLILIFGLLLTINADVDKSEAKVVEKPEVLDEPPVVDIKISKEEIPKLVDIIKVWKLIDEVELGQLSEERMVKFLAVYKQMDRIRWDYYRSRRNTMDKIKQLLETNSSDEQLRIAVSRFYEIEEEFYQKQRELREKLNSELTPHQRASLIVFQDSQRHEIRRLMLNLEKLSKLRERQLKYQPEPLTSNK